MIIVKNTTKMDEYNLSRKQQVQEKKEDVLKKALNLFLEHSIVTISMMDIAKVAGISRVTMYRYFNSKDELIFTIASRMMVKIFKVAFKDISFDSTKEITVGYKNMVRKFNELEDAYQYLSMFDALWTKNHPSADLRNIYKNQFENLISDKIYKLSEKEIVRHVMMINLTMDYLEDLSVHGDFIELTQNVSTKALLDEFESTIDAIMQI